MFTGQVTLLMGIGRVTPEHAAGAGATPMDTGATTARASAVIMSPPRTATDRLLMMPPQTALVPVEPEHT
ncbi:hypothetical protein DZF91_15085 [Actinomadura logoneensis]|uniref:Uncharacterized protein n=1 Tax=Actinomadura logoneensis TaxID=2293572 RepID=A0A372JLG3_9ACTN|nr:hypothetical protein DZF91_15085 [Actinomadura logoneensis]